MRSQDRKSSNGYSEGCLSICPVVVRIGDLELEQMKFYATKLATEVKVVTRFP